MTVLSVLSVFANIYILFIGHLFHIYVSGFACARVSVCDADSSNCLDVTETGKVLPGAKQPHGYVPESVENGGQLLVWNLALNL